MALTESEDRRIQAIEAKMNQLQGAMNRLGTRREIKQIIALLQIEVERLKDQLAQYETLQIGPALDAHKIDPGAHTELDARYNTRYYLKTEIATILTDYYTKAEVDTLLNGGSGSGGSGWIAISDVTGQGTISAFNKTYFDPPNNTIIQSAEVSGLDIFLAVRASSPIVLINSIPYTLDLAGDTGHYSKTVPLTLDGAGTLNVTLQTPDNEVGASDNIDIDVVVPPEITSLSFFGGYPGSQTELKAGDTFQVTGTTDKAVDRVQIADFGAFTGTTITVSGTGFTVTGTVANRGTSTQALAASLRARDASTAAWGPYRATNELEGTVDGVNLVNLNNLYPSVSLGSPTYPLTQQALKGSETATVPSTITNADTVLFDSPNSQLSILNPTTIEATKTVTRLIGSYNISTNNLRATANRAANDATTVDQTVVRIANVAATITVTEPAARLRSGGNDGTSAQNHTITVSGDQLLLSVSMDEGASGTFLGSWSGSPPDATWTRSLQVHDNDTKGTFSWQNLVATNLAGIQTTTITGNSQYVLGGFVSRTVTWQAFQTISDNVSVEIADFSKIQAGLWSATNQSSVRYPIGTSPPQTDGYTASAVATSLHTVAWLDTAAAGSNSGLAYLYNYEEVV